MDATSLLPIITGSLVLGGLLGGLIGNVRKGNKQQQSEVIGLQQNEIAAYESANKRLSNDNAALAAENTALKQSNKDLKGIAQQTPEIKKLIEVVSKLVAEIGKQNNNRKKK